jgi:DNA-binding Lrp family transcriptional regulator
MNLPSSLYKETGVSHDTPGVSPTTPQDRARRISGHPKGAERFGRHTLVSVVDGRLSDKAFRLLALLECCAWDAPIRLAFEEMAEAIDSSRPQVIRHVKALESVGYIAVRRTHNQRNEYSVVGITGTKIRGRKLEVAAPETKPAKELVRCPKCSKNCGGLLKAGWCRGCNADLKVRRIVRDEMRKSA